MTLVPPKSETSALNLAILTSRFEGIVRAMSNTLLRTSRCLSLSVGRDFSCAIVTAADQLLAVADSLPIHVFAGPEEMAQQMRILNPGFCRGDAFLNNSPYHGNSHAADWSILVPVFGADDVHRFTIVTKAHMVDCGNAVPTTINPTARDVYEEGALIFPSVRVQADYQHNEDILRMCRSRVRVPDLWYGDYLAILGAARIGEQRILDLLAEYTAERLEQYANDWFAYSEAQMAAAIARMPAGEVTTETRHDPFPGAPDGIPVRTTVTVDPEHGKITVDLRDNLDCLPLGVNLTETTSMAAARVGVCSGLGGSPPLNHGSFRRLHTKLRENCIVGIPRHPASCSTATTHLAEHVSKCVTLGLATLADGFGQAEVGKAMPPSTATISGRDPRKGNRPFVNFILLVLANGAGTPWADGWLTLLTLGTAGQHGHDSIELDELRYPIRVREQRIVPDSEGAGRFRGAPSVYSEYGPIGTEMEVMYASDGTVNAPRGARGGMAGAPARQHHRRVDGTVVELGPWDRVQLKDGETIISVCTGGGGYGRPSERGVDAVARDVREGWVTAKKAFDVYGVALDDGRVDVGATRRRRLAISARA